MPKLKISNATFQVIFKRLCISLLSNETFKAIFKHCESHVEIGNEWIENRFWRRIDLHTWMFDYEFVLCSWWSQFLKSVLSSHWMMIWKWLHAYAPSSHFSRLTLFLPLLGLQWHTLHLAANARTTLMFVQKKINRQNDLKISHPRDVSDLSKYRKQLSPISLRHKSAGKS